MIRKSRYGQTYNKELKGIVKVNVENERVTTTGRKIYV
jgi:hypothetical protein